MSKFENTSDQQPQNTNVQQEPFKNLDDLIRNHWPSGTHEGGGALNEELRQTIKTSLEDAKAIAKARIIPLELPHHRCLCFHLYNMVTDMERRANGRFTDFVNLERKAEREGNNAMKNHAEEWGRWWNEHRSKLNQVLKDIEVPTRVKCRLVRLGLRKRKKVFTTDAEKLERVERAMKLYEEKRFTQWSREDRAKIRRRSRDHDDGEWNAE
ncbi:hypothetical protein D9758_013980 [Tetrapyrgos nigripes]|uniref:Uncharacterized protein n=1 Tax=Tetrapyrgos nigripes TaxID=182062 RepID=A0A8H5G7P4_9AGAR|nr:hypothetical protein D9758_013980 [Tetrapyrgos nigripes]